MNGKQNKETPIFENGASISAEQFAPLEYAIEPYFPQGLILLSGIPKIGKSWLAMQAASAVSNGGKFLNGKATKGEVLYLGFEDTRRRINFRLSKFPNADVSKITFLIKQGGDLVNVIKKHISDNPNTRLVVIDTLEHARRIEQPNRNGKSIYSDDSNFMNRLREILPPDQPSESPFCNLTILVIHHNKKGQADETQDLISGSNGLMGGTDGNLILHRSTERSKKIFLTTEMRDIESGIYRLEFDKSACAWNYVGKADEDGRDCNDNEFVNDIKTFADEINSWSGTATELLSELQRREFALDFTAPTFVKKLKSLSEYLKYKSNVVARFLVADNKKIIEIEK